MLNDIASRQTVQLVLVEEARRGSKTAFGKLSWLLPYSGTDGL